MILSLAALSLIGASIWLLSRVHASYSAGLLDWILFEPQTIELELEPTIVARFGDRVRYMLFLSHLVASRIRILARKKPPFRVISFRRELWQQPRFFPSFSQWKYQERRRRRDESRRPSGSSFPSPTPPEEYVHLAGTIKLPNRIYVNDSCVVRLDLLPELTYITHDRPELSVVRDDTAGVRVVAEWRGDKCKLEAELVGVGVEVTSLGPDIQEGRSLHYAWGCRFPHSGLQILALRLRLLAAGSIAWRHAEHRVRVVQCNGFTSRQVAVLAALGAAAGIVSTVLALLRAVGPG